MTDFRALCAELHAAVQLYTGQNPAAADTPPNELVSRLMDAMAATAAALAQPEPQGPTDEELRHVLLDCGYHPANRHLIAPARAILARYGRPAIEPVPVSERLPKMELNELDGQGTCWMFHPVNYHYCLCLPDPSVHTHWLPHWALPVPKRPRTNISPKV